MTYLILPAIVRPPGNESTFLPLYFLRGIILDIEQRFRVGRVACHNSLEGLSNNGPGIQNRLTSHPNYWCPPYLILLVVQLSLLWGWKVGSESLLNMYVKVLYKKNAVGLVLNRISILKCFLLQSNNDLPIRDPKITKSTQSAAILWHQHIRCVAQKDYQHRRISSRCGKNFLSLCLRKDRARCRENKCKDEDRQNLIIAFRMKFCLSSGLESK